jgi:putative transposase
MPRKPVKYQSEFPYHIYNRTVNGETFKIPLNQVWSIMEDYLYLTTIIYNLHIHSFVLMPNHFHLIAETPDSNLGSAMNFFMKETSVKINRAAGRINQTYGGRYGRTLISNEAYLVTVHKYVYRNPVRAQLCRRVEDYKYSTLRGLIGQSKLVIPVIEDPILFCATDSSRNFAWLNRPTQPEHDLEIQTALRKFVTCRKTGRPSRLESELY